MKTKKEKIIKQKDLKRMSRKDLLQVLLLQSKKIDKLETKLKTANELLESKKIAIENVGSIAEASLKLNKVFESAQAAADQYLENIKMLNSDNELIVDNKKKEVSQEKNKTSSSKKKKGIKKKKTLKESR